MGKCELCGKWAGLFRGIHPACEQERDEQQAADRINEAADIATIAQIRAELSLACEGSTSVEAALSKSVELASDKPRLLWSAFAAWINVICKDDTYPPLETEHVAKHAIDRFKFNVSELPDRLWNRYVMLCAGRDLREGKIPERVAVTGDIPFLLERDEKFVWLFQQVEYLEDKIVRSGNRGYAGVSVRVARGIYVHGGESAQQAPVQGFISVDNGMLAITNRAVLFKGVHGSHRFRYKDIVAIERFDYGFSICAGTKAARNQGFEIPGSALPGFPYMLIHSLANIYKQSGLR